MALPLYLLSAAMLLAGPPPASLNRRIDALLSTEAAREARWGVHVVSLSDGHVIYQRNANERFAPASNTKLFSTALALERLGPDYRLLTRVVGTRSPDAAGTIAGDLHLVGGGDPSLSGRAFPYQKNGQPGNPVEPVEQLADEIIRAGVRIITGDIVGDDRRYVWEPYPEGWTIDDAIWDYGAPVSALPFNDNAFTLVLRPAPQAGDPAVLSINPPFVPFVFDNRVRTVHPGAVSIRTDRLPGTRQVKLSGTIALGNGAVRQLLAVEDPAHYAAAALYDVLTRKGVVILGSPVALHRWPSSGPPANDSAVEMARRVSPPLAELAAMVNKVSQNLHAEILLREAAMARGRDATRENGLKELDAFVEEIGIHKRACHFEDASGLSRRTLIAPAAITRLLVYMDGRPMGKVWDAMMPVGGEDGTLSARFEKAPRARAIHAKTGTLASANALSGYLTTRSGARLAFSVIANNHNGPSSEIRAVIDRIGLALLDWEGK
jgi:D-alanyl-D-alanine carboxypeptidase/D-alanyl-D-alanine-endopeptidase (penicillin-binding protein 4)